MNTEALKAKHLLEETDCYHCTYYNYDKCMANYINIGDTLPKELHCMDFEAGKPLDAAEELMQAVGGEVKIGIDRMIMDIVNGN